MQRKTTRIGESIILTLMGFWFAQMLIFHAFGIPSGFAPWLYDLFFIASIPSHVVIFALLFALRDAFVIEATGERLEKVNLANKITISRISALPTILVLIVAAKEYPIQIPLLVLIASVFATDFLDGWVSRSRGQVTRMGKILDSTSDYCLLIVLTFAFWVFSLIPDWILACILARLAFQVVAVGIIFIAKKNVEPKSTPFGKVAIATVMALYAIELFRHALQLRWDTLFLVVEIAASAVVVASIGDKAIVLFNELKRRPGGGTGDTPR